ncbi:MAG TPA: hypothetical protein VJM14_14835 [Burkholderiales bacterium]|nr:hypothetical protein [Burkholderiales bacterium]
MESAVFGLIGVLVGAILTGVREWWFQNRKNKKDAEYLAIQVSCQLGRFIAGCAGVAGDDRLCEGQTDKDGYSSIQVESPTLALNDLKVEWKVLPANLLYSILQFPIVVPAGRLLISMTPYSSGSFAYYKIEADHSLEGHNIDLRLATKRFDSQR